MPRGLEQRTQGLISTCTWYVQPERLRMVGKRDMFHPLPLHLSSNVTPKLTLGLTLLPVQVHCDDAQ